MPTELQLDEINSVEAANEIIPSVVQITWSDKSGMKHYNGTGVVWNKNGIFSTNYHVIAGADPSNLRVTFADNTTLGNVRVLHCFKDLDFAVLHVDAPRDKLKPIPVGDSSKLCRGQKAYAIGHPHGCRNSFSGGYISGVDCVVPSTVTGVQIRGLIQTDASINPGNSGGPLLDSSKKLIGINTCMISPGVAFAIPGNLAKEIVDMAVRSANDTTPNSGIESPPYHPVEWGINIGNYANANGMCVEVSEIVKSMKASLGTESSPYHFVGQSVGIPNPVNEVCVEVSGSADMMVRSVMDKRPNSRIESSPHHQSVNWSDNITNSANEVCGGVKLKDHDHCHHHHQDVIGYFSQQAFDLKKAYSILQILDVYGKVKMHNGDVIVNRGYCAECKKMELDILPRDHMGKCGPDHPRRANINIFRTLDQYQQRREAEYRQRRDTQQYTEPNERARRKANLKELLKSFICCCPATSSRKAISCIEAGANDSTNLGSRNFKCSTSTRKVVSCTKAGTNKSTNPGSRNIKCC